MVLGLILSIIIIGILVTVFIIGSSFLLRDSIFITVPFVSTKKRAIPSIVQALDLSSGSVLYDLGCGNGEVLKAATAKIPGIKAVGIERGYIPFLLSKWNVRGLPIVIRFQDIFSADLSEATHVYCYLSPQMMEQLLPKFERECKQGTRIVSCDFQLPNIVPVQTISLCAGNEALSRTLYVYEMGR